MEPLHGVPARKARQQGRGRSLAVAFILVGPVDQPPSTEPKELGHVLDLEALELEVVPHIHNVDVHGKKDGMLSKKQWSVTGSTQPTAVSLDILNQWVGWMVVAGAENGGCEFDGWGAEAP